MTHFSNIYDVVSDSVGTADPNLNTEEIETAVLPRFRASRQFAATWSTTGR